MERTVEIFNRNRKERETERLFYEMLLNRIDFCILVINRQKHIQWINKATLDVFGIPRPKVLDDLKKISPELPDLIATMTPEDTKIVHFNRAQPMAVSMVHFYTGDKEYKLVSIKNIKSVLEKNESEAWKKLIRVLTHEMMNSLTPVISLSETFANQDFTDADMLKRAMQTIYRRSKGLVEFVNNYRRLTHIPQPVVTQFLAIEWIEDVHRLMEADSYRFSYRIIPADLRITADRALLEQALINIIRNACEATPSGEGVKQPEVKIANDELMRTVISISDEGEGIKPDVMDKIFVPFYTTKSDGSGIGLTISRQIVNLHGGIIHVRSEPDKGSCFTIRI
jgi:nitrogen fixation/metabolism regulation signal transduction histidine kinase